MLDPTPLLNWMHTRRGDVTMRSIGEDGPRAFRRSADNGPALAALIDAGRIVEVSSRPRAFRVVGSASAAAGSASGSRLPQMLLDAAAELDGLPSELAAYWAAVTVRDEIIGRARVSRGLPAVCECCSWAGQKVDEAVVAAFGCEMPGADGEVA